MKVTKEINLGGKIFSLETGRFAKQADGAVMARFGDTMVLATVVASKQESDKFDYFPLQVEYREKFASAGKIPGGFFSVKPAVGEGSPRVPPHRQADPADVSRLVPVRDAGDRHRLLVRPGT